jgi:hypothetical protein
MLAKQFILLVLELESIAIAVLEKCNENMGHV